MKVVFLSPEYPPGPSGGIGVAVRSLAGALATRGHRVWVVVPGAGRAEEEDAGVHVRRIRVDHPPRLGWLVVRRALAREVRALVATHGADVVATVDWLGLSAGLRSSAPVVVHCHGSATYFSELLGTHLRPLDRWAERRAVRGADAVTAVSTFTSARTAALFGLHEMPAVIPNGLDAGPVPPPPHGVEVLHLGTVVRKKGALDLGPAFSRVVEAVPDARLRVVGRDTPDPSTGAASTWSLAAAGLSPAAAPRARYDGPLPHHELRAVIEQAAVCLFPSYAEACPLTWLEAMAAGRPVVGYRLPWAEELVEHDRSGWLAPAGDAEAAGRLVADALADGDALVAAGRAARARVEEHFGLDALVAATTAAYRASGARP